MSRPAPGKKRKVWLVLLLAVVMSIFLFSQQSGPESAWLSNKVAAFLGLEGQGIFDASGRPLVLGLSLRKLAHIFMFALLGFCSMGYFRSWRKAAAFCLACALLDEGHQILVAGRTGMIKDVVIDAVGAVIGIIGKREYSNTLK